MADYEEQTTSSKLAGVIEKNKKAFIIVLIVIICLLAGYIVFAAINNKAKDKALQTLDEISYEMTKDSSELTDAELDARIAAALDKAAALTKKGGIVGARANMFCADISFRAENYDASANYWLEAAAKAKKTYIAPLAYFNAAVCYENLGKTDLAAENYKLAADDEDFGLEPVSVTILQHGVPVALSFAASSFTMNTSQYTGVATSTNGNVRVNLRQAQRSGSGNNAYIQLGRDWNQGSITVTPLNGMVLTGITVTYSDEDYGELDTDYNPKASVSVGSYSRSGATGTWTGSSADAVTITNGYANSFGRGYYPRITNIAVTYEAAN